MSKNTGVLLTYVYIYKAPPGKEDIQIPVRIVANTTSYGARSSVKGSLKTSWDEEHWEDFPIMITTHLGEQVRRQTDKIAKAKIELGDLKEKQKETKRERKRLNQIRRRERRRIRKQETMTAVGSMEQDETEDEPSQETEEDTDEEEEEEEEEEKIEHEHSKNKEGQERRVCSAGKYMIIAKEDLEALLRESEPTKGRVAQEVRKAVKQAEAGNIGKEEKSKQKKREKVAAVSRTCKQKEAPQDETLHLVIEERWLSPNAMIINKISKVQPPNADEIERAKAVIPALHQPKRSEYMWAKSDGWAYSMLKVIIYQELNKELTGNTELTFGPRVFFNTIDLILRIQKREFLPKRDGARIIAARQQKEEVRNVSRRKQVVTTYKPIGHTMPPLFGRPKTEVKRGVRTVSAQSREVDPTENVHIESAAWTFPYTKTKT